jgi:hypothetical protein
MAPIARHCQANWHTVGHRINPRQKAGQQRPEDSYNEIPERTKAASFWSSGLRSSLPTSSRGGCFRFRP